MTISFVGVAGNVVDSTGSDHTLTVAKPTGTADGDLVLVHMIDNDAVPLFNSCIYIISGSNVTWTDLITTGEGGSHGDSNHYVQFVYPRHNYLLGWRVASSDPSSYTFTVESSFFTAGYSGYAIQAITYRDAAVSASASRYDASGTPSSPQSTLAVGVYGTKAFGIPSITGLALCAVDLIGTAGDHLWVGFAGCGSSGSGWTVPTGATQRDFQFINSIPFDSALVCDGFAIRGNRFWTALV